MLASLRTLSLVGLEAEIVDIEVDLHRGLPRFVIVGLGDAAIQESKERVRSAIKNSGFQFPNGVVTVNLAPADLKKQGPQFDLAIAIGILQATGQLELPEKILQYALIGELGFSGEIRAGKGILPLVAEAVRYNFVQVIIPKENEDEASLVNGIEIIAVSSLLELGNHFSAKKIINSTAWSPLETAVQTPKSSWDLSHIKGNEHAKRALEIAAAGGHNLLMCGPPGSGKTMLAQGLSTILPNLQVEEALEITKIHSVAGLTSSRLAVIRNRPFRSVHHTASGVAIVGGGNPPRPGEISLAHRGVLFLDELPEFASKTLEVLRQPLEDGVITISRASGSYNFPARMMLVAAMNPCPCGFFGDAQKACHCSQANINRYQQKISGPLLDRLDMYLNIPRVPVEQLKALSLGEGSAAVRQRVEKARLMQSNRFAKLKIRTNNEMTSAQTKNFCHLTTEAEGLLQKATQQMNLSGRAYFRLLKLGRTIADLANSESITMEHMAEAVQYRAPVLEG